jgi:uncharacterized protein (TIGR02246 family)
MMHRRLLCISFAVIAASVAGCTTTGVSQTARTSEDEAAIRTVIVEMTEGFNKHDAKAATRMYTADADFVSVRGDASIGGAQVEKGLATVLATRARDATLKTLDVKIRFIRPDVALAHVTNELSGLVNPDGQKLPAHREISIRVLVKDQGRWQVAAFHNTMIAPFR